MKLGIMQPYFFPYSQQFRHIAQCDLWIVFDTVKFTRKSWTSRNRIANKTEEFTYISVPIKKGASKGRIFEAPIADISWQQALFDKLHIYRGSAPYYSETVNIVENCISRDLTNLAALNFNIIKNISAILEINTEIKRLSDMRLHLPDAAEPGDWALLISKEIGAKVYSNAPAGRHLFDPEKYAENGINLEFYEPVDFEYKTPNFNFVPDLSIIDSLMWVGIHGVRAFVNE